MPIVQSISATEPDRVLVEPRGAVSDVWLRKNAVKDTAERLMGDEVATQDFWTYEEVHLVMPGTPTADEVEAEFDALWAANSDGRTASQVAHDAEDAVADLSETVSDNALGASELEDAIAELSELVSKLTEEVK